MASTTKITWTDATWNPVSGCTRISPGCDHCYIERTPPMRIAGRRFDGPGVGATTGVQLHPERLEVPRRWKNPKRVFVCSMADLFHTGVPDEYIAQVFAIMADCTQHTFQVLTKRPARMRSLLRDRGFWDRVTNLARDKGARFCFSLPEGLCWLPNVWCGTTVEDQQQVEQRGHILTQTPAAVRWLSAEPLLSSINLARLLPRQFESEQGGYWLARESQAGTAGAGPLWMTGPSIGWVVCGGETGPKARPILNTGWVRNLRDQCSAARVPFHFKQWGEWIPSDQLAPEAQAGEQKKVGPRTVYRVGRKTAGRHLDGALHDAYPEAGQ